MAAKTIAFTCQHCQAIFHRFPRRTIKYCSIRCCANARWTRDREPVLTRFMRYVSQSETGCWIWIGHKSRSGYGQIQVNRRPCRANRVAYELFIGPIPEGLQICHRCDIPACVNPSHLFAGTGAENQRDSCLKARRCRKLTPDKVRAIRADPRMHTVIAAEYGIASSYVCNLKKRNSWRHLD